MKKTFNLIYASLAIFLAVCLSVSCQKDGGSDASSTTLNVKKAQSIYESGKQSYVGDPQWEKAYTFSRSDTGVTLKVPLAVGTGIKELVFVQYKDQSVHQYVLYALPEIEYIKSKSVNSENAGLNQLVNISDYTGVIYEFKTNGQFIKGDIYQSGKILNSILPGNSQTETDVKIRTFDNDANCNNPKGPWIQYCQTRGQLPPVIIVAPPIGGGGSLPPVGTNPPPPIVTGPSSGWSTNLVLYNNVNGERITNIADYLKCLNRNAGATVTIYIDQPKANATDTWSGSPLDPDVGHTFVSISQDGITRTYGFYPGSGVNPFTSPSTGSVLINDAGHPFDVSVTVQVSAAQLQSVISTSTNFAKTYNLNTYNCTDFGLSISSAAGIGGQSATGTWPGGGGHNPGNFGQDMRSKSLSAGSSRNTTGGNAPQNKGNCQ